MPGGDGRDQRRPIHDGGGCETDGNLAELLTVTVGERSAFVAGKREYRRDSSRDAGCYDPLVVRLGEM